MDTIYSFVSSLVVLLTKNDMVIFLQIKVCLDKHILKNKYLIEKRRTLNDKSGLDLQELAEAVNNTKSIVQSNIQNL